MTQQHLPLWYLGNIAPELCDKAMEDFDKIEPQDAKMGATGEHSEHRKRNTTVRFVAAGHWFGDTMYAYALEANKVCGWNYDITGHENIQYGQYGPDQHYGWHTDTFTLSGQPYDRKVSVVCMLSDPSEYEGGEFLIRLYNEYQPKLEKGSIIAFPSIIEHQVLPVTEGLRKSAVIWSYGPRFK